MATLQLIDQTTVYPDGKIGDDAFDAFAKVNSNFQALQAAADMSAVSVAINQALYWNGTAWSPYVVSAAARAMLAAADAAGIRSSIKAVGTEGNETVGGVKTYTGAATFNAGITLPSSQNVTFAGGGGQLGGSTGIAVLAGSPTGSTAAIILRPMGIGSSTNQISIWPDGSMSFSATQAAKNLTMTSLGAATVAALNAEITARADADSAEASARAAADTALSARMIGRNQLINGDFRFAQRGSNFAVAASGRYGLDRWFMSGTGSQIGSAQMTTGGTGIPNTLQNRPKNAMQVTVNSVAGAGNNALMVQRIEDVSTLAGGKATFSGWVWGNVTTAISVGLYQFFGTTGASAVVKVNAQKINVVANQWNYVTLTFDIPHVVGKTITANNCLWLNLWLDAGANYDGAGDAGGIGQKSGTYWFSQLQLEAGANATPFEFRRDAVELTLCQRYYEKSPDIDVLPSTPNYFGRFCIGMSSVTGSQIFVGVPFKTTKRNTPSIAVWSSTNTPAVGMIGQDDGSTTPAAVGNIGMNGYQVSWSNTAGRWGGFFQWAADSEL